MLEFENNYPQSNRNISKMNWNLHIVRVTLRELTGLTILDSRTKIFYRVIYFINSNENAKTVLTLSISKTVLLSPKKFHITHVCMCLPGWDSRQELPFQIPISSMAWAHQERNMACHSLCSSLGIVLGV